MYNSVKLIGNLGKDVITRDFSNGGRVANFSLATSKKYKDKSGEQVTKTQWHNVVIKNDHLVGIAERFLKKGSKCLIEGELENREYESEGTTKYITEVVLNKYDGKLLLLDSKGDNQEQKPQTPTPQPQDLSDEIPF